MKDNFSTESDLYAQYRPTYPEAFFTYLKSLLPHMDNAWDCGTANGQVAVKLADFFTHVYATDISASQLKQATNRPNIYYSVQAAEQTDFKPNFFDLILVAQAIHWFDFNRFYAEVDRTARKNALLVVMGYSHIHINAELDAIINHLYADILEPNWDKERKYIDEGYQTIPFSFEEIPTPSFEMNDEWTLPHLVGYLHTWSAVKYYRNENGTNPVDAIYDVLKMNWGHRQKRRISFPLLLRIGIKK